MPHAQDSNLSILPALACAALGKCVQGHTAQQIDWTGSRGKLLYKYRSFYTVLKAEVAKSTGHSAEDDPLAELDFC